MMKHLSTLLLGLALTGCQVGISASSPTPAASASSPAAGGQTGAQAQANAADRAFIDGMVPHHEMALMMADDALDKASHAELRSFATKVKTDQQREIDQLKSWRAQWFGSATTPPMDHSNMMMAAAGANFDKEWSEEMIEHHQGAIDMAKQALAAAARPEIKQMAQAIIAAQTQEQTQLRGYIDAWY